MRYNAACFFFWHWFTFCSPFTERMMMNELLLVRAEWDRDVCVWVATSDDVPGLATEAETLEELCSKLERMIPELLNANSVPISGGVPFELLARRFSTVCPEPVS
ncbi:MAG: DUF1902 domain-containing protein [Azoarcus sp.]|nr:DUF1902 domain-containing protein [Azoarcus sp.]